MLSFRTLIPGVSVALCLVGCATSSAPDPVEIPLQSGAAREFWSQLLAADVIYLPEVHDNESHHRLQSQVIAGLDDRGETILLGMEMFTRDQQPLLDRWHRGRLSLDALFESVNWNASWGGYSELYAVILNDAAARDIPVRGLNAPKRLVRTVATGEPVDPRDRRWLPESFETPPGGLAFFRTQMQGHPGMKSSQVERYYAVQALWEQTMAQAILELHQQQPDRKIVVMLGRGHSDPRFGVPFYVGQKSEVRQLIVDLEDTADWRLSRSNGLEAIAHE